MLDQLPEFTGGNFIYNLKGVELEVIYQYEKVRYKETTGEEIKLLEVSTMCGSNIYPLLSDWAAMDISEEAKNRVWAQYGGTNEY